MISLRLHGLISTSQATQERLVGGASEQQKSADCTPGHWRRWAWSWGWGRGDAVWMTPPPSHPTSPSSCSIRVYQCLVVIRVVVMMPIHIIWGGGGTPSPDCQQSQPTCRTIKPLLPSNQSRRNSQRRVQPTAHAARTIAGLKLQQWCQSTVKTHTHTQKSSSVLFNHISQSKGPRTHTLSPSERILQIWMRNIWTFFTSQQKKFLLQTTRFQGFFNLFS